MLDHQHRCVAVVVLAVVHHCQPEHVLALGQVGHVGAGGSSIHNLRDSRRRAGLNGPEVGGDVTVIGALRAVKSHKI